MPQLSLCTPAELAGMRDRAACRDYSPGRDEFRREHEHHRVWGLARRHAERLRRRRSAPDDRPAASATEGGREGRVRDLSPPRTSTPTACQQAIRPAPGGNCSTSQDPARGHATPDVQAEPAGTRVEAGLPRLRGDRRPAASRQPLTSPQGRHPRRHRLGARCHSRRPVIPVSIGNSLQINSVGSANSGGRHHSLLCDGPRFPISGRPP
jgi:hypothetical protein